MLHIYNIYASSHGLVFNAAKTQLICSRHGYDIPFIPDIIFNGSKLKYIDEVTHLGHILSYNLDDKQDIIRAIKDMNRKDNSILCKFSSLDPSVKCFLLKSYCLSLYGCSLWSLSTPSLRAIEVAYRILRRIWNLPQRSHTSIVHCTAEVPTVSHMVYNRFCSLLVSMFSSPSMFLKSAIYTVYLFFYWL